MKRFLPGASVTIVAALCIAQLVTYEDAHAAVRHRSHHPLPNPTFLAFTVAASYWAKSPEAGST